VGGKYKDPTANININAALFLILKFKVLSSGIGIRINTTSSTILNAAPERINPVELMHFDCILRSQIELIGMHCKASAMKNARVRRGIKIKATFVTRRKPSEGKIRR
jgi:hypothetical protein